MRTDNTILLADKDRELCDALEKYLTRYGYGVVKTETGQSALSAVSGNSPAVVISGTHLQDMPGVELLRALREKFPQIQVVMIVDEGDIDSGLECLRLGASDYISKPINSEAMGVALDRAFERRETWFRFRRYDKELEVAKKNKDLSQQLFDEVPCYISLQDENFRLTGANKRFKKDFGDNIGSYCYEVYKHRSEPCVECPVEATFKDGKPHQTEEVLTSQHGEQYNVLTWTAPLKDATGKITQVMEMSTNITQIRKLQSHLTSLGLLLGSMSHGIRGVLTALDGGIYRLEAGLKKGNQEQINDAMEVVKSMIYRIRSMILDILYYTKERDLNWTRVNVLDFSHQVAALVRPNAEKNNIEFVYDFDQPDLFFEIDPGTVSSALVNILENSIDACVDDKSDDKSYKVIFGVNANENHVVFEAIDNGIGMDRQTRENLFTLFFSSKGHRGTGLGLFISNEIVEQHGGIIEVDSEPGKGSRFQIKLPRVLPEELKKGKGKKDQAQLVG
ncbi:MAG: response regulator [Deltaproteobacteria bacterium]|nr:response regulator [Deltaproteobacteria bacterium]